MNFGPASPDLLPGAKNAVETCLAIKPGEGVALIADLPSRAVAASLAAAVENVHALCTSLLLEDFGPRPIKAAPAAVLAALETTDIGVLCMNPQPGEVGELAVGTKLVLSDMIGILLQDEKFPGVHNAFGDPYGSQTHADWKSRTHVDVLTRDCDVWIDEDQIIEKGHYQLEHLGLA